MLYASAEKFFEFIIEEPQKNLSRKSKVFRRLSHTNYIELKSPFIKFSIFGNFFGKLQKCNIFFTRINCDNAYILYESLHFLKTTYRLHILDFKGGAHLGRSGFVRDRFVGKKTFLGRNFHHHQLTYDDSPEKVPKHNSHDTWN